MGKRPPPPPSEPLPNESASVGMVMAFADRVMVLQTEHAHMQQQIEQFKADVERLESERQWWRRWHLKWGPLFRRWRDGGSGDE